MIDHTGIGVKDVVRSAVFYDTVLAVLGLGRAMEPTGDEGPEGIGYGQNYPVFWIDRFHPNSTKKHTAFRAKSRAEMDAFHAAALTAGGTDNGAPGIRSVEDGNPPGYYAAFTLDPDGNNIEAVYREV